MRVFICLFLMQAIFIREFALGSVGGRLQAVVIGAGISGLMSSLVLAQEGYEVIVVEKRGAVFERSNIVSLKAESASVLSELGLFEDFVAQVATRLEYHAYFNFEDGRYVEVRREVLNPFQKKATLSFEAQSVGNSFKESGLYAVTLSEFQQFLATRAANTGHIRIFTNADVSLRGDDRKSVLVTQGKISKEFSPDLLVLADGAGKTRLRGDAGEEIFEQAVEREHPSEGESWIYGNVLYGGKKSFVSNLFDKSASDFTQIANVIFDARRGLANVAISVSENELREDLIANKIREVAQTAFSLNGMNDPITLHSFNKRVVKISNRIGKTFVLGTNLIAVGDRAGVSSPLAGLGATLATTAYPYGVRRVARAVRSKTKHELNCALEIYAALAEASVRKWFADAKANRNFIREHLNPKNQ